MKKALVLLSLGCLFVTAFVGGLFRWAGRPLYSPGTISREEGLGSSLEPVREATGTPDYFPVAPGIRLFATRVGRGPAALVVHGGPGFPPREPWEGLRALEQRFELVYYHQRGSGASTHPIDKLPHGGFRDVDLLHRTLGLGEQIADIERIRRLLGEERILLIGHSFGAFLAALYAGEFPDRTKALILLAPADLIEFPPPGGGLLEQIRGELPTDRQPAYANLVARNLDFANLLRSDEGSLAALHRDLIGFYTEAAKRRGFEVPKVTSNDNGGWMVVAAYLGMGRSHDWRSSLGAFKGPVLVVHGGRDLQPEEITRRYTAYFPQARFVTIPEAGHFVYRDAPQLLARELGAFVDGW